MPKSSDKPFRKWCFTWNQNAAYPGPPQFEDADMHYMVFQLEEAPETKQLHYQGYVALKNAIRMTGVKKLLKNPQLHLEQCRDEERAIKYCKKQSTRAGPTTEWGSRPGQGKRNLLQEACKQIQGGRDVTDVAHEFPEMFVKHYKGLAALGAALHVPKIVDRKVYVLRGAAGVGKTRSVYRAFPARAIYNVFSATAPWFDGYIPGVHQVALFDDYCKKGRMPLDVHKKVTDRYPIMLPIKGGSVPWCVPIVIFTTNEYSGEWFGDEHALHQDAIQRRITKEWHIEWTDNSAHREADALFTELAKGFVGTGVAPIEIDDDGTVSELCVGDLQQSLEPFEIEEPLPLRRVRGPVPDLPAYTGRVLLPDPADDDVASSGADV